jgi:predicted small lipoprotein YifL
VTTVTAVTALVALTALSACGKRGAPLPPLRAVPAPAKDFSAFQRGNQLLLRLTYPKTTPGGQALAGISTLEIWRATRPVAPAAPASPASPASPPATPSTEAAATPTDPNPPELDAREFQGVAEKIATLTTAEIGAATQGDRIVFPLELPSPPPSEVYYLAVRTRGPEGDLSAWSNQAKIAPAVAPVSPSSLTALARVDGIELSWLPVSDALGYVVYRRDASSRSYGEPIATVVAPETKTTDNKAVIGSSYIYAVTSVARRAPILESSIQREVEVRYNDRFPPSPVRDLVALSEAGKIRLVWSASDAQDVVGYRVYRRDGAGAEFRALQAQARPETEFEDSTLSFGQRATYRVTAVDGAGNESEPKEAEAALR